MDLWILIFAGIATVAVLGWIINAIMYVRRPPEHVSTKELEDALAKAEELVVELQETVVEILRDLPENSSYFTSDGSHIWGRMGKSHE